GDGSLKSPAVQPIIYNTGFAFAYPAIAPNSLGGLGGAIMYGGGTTYENCAAILADQYTTDASGWSLPAGFFSNADPSDRLSGDYLAARGNGGNPRTWSASCYTLRDDNGTGTT